MISLETRGMGAMEERDEGITSFPNVESGMFPPVCILDRRHGGGSTMFATFS